MRCGVGDVDVDDEADVEVEKCLVMGMESDAV